VQGHRASQCTTTSLNQCANLTLLYAHRSSYSLLEGTKIPKSENKYNIL